MLNILMKSHFDVVLDFILIYFKTMRMQII